MNKFITDFVMFEILLPKILLFNILNVWAYIEYKWMIFRKIFKSIKKKKIYIRLGIKYKQ